MNPCEMHHNNDEYIQTEKFFFSLVNRKNLKIDIETKKLDCQYFFK